MVTTGVKTIKLKLKRHELVLDKETDMGKVWRVDPAIPWDLVRFRSIRNLDDNCMSEGLTAVRYAPQTQLLRIFHDDAGGTRRSMALYVIDPADRAIEESVDAHVEYEASSPWKEIPTYTPLTETPLIRPSPWGDTQDSALDLSVDDMEAMSEMSYEDHFFPIKTTLRMTELPDERKRR